MARYFSATGIGILTDELFVMVHVTVPLNWLSAAFIKFWPGWNTVVPCVAVACNIGACVWMYIVVYHYQWYYVVLILYCQLSWIIGYQVQGLMYLVMVLKYSGNGITLTRAILVMNGNTCAKSHVVNFDCTLWWGDIEKHIAQVNVVVKVSLLKLIPV